MVGRCASTRGAARPTFLGQNARPAQGPGPRAMLGLALLAPWAATGCGTAPAPKERTPEWVATKAPTRGCRDYAT